MLGGLGRRSPGPAWVLHKPVLRGASPDAATRTAAPSALQRSKRPPTAGHCFATGSGQLSLSQHTDGSLDCMVWCASVQHPGLYSATCPPAHLHPFAYLCQPAVPTRSVAAPRWQQPLPRPPQTAPPHSAERHPCRARRVGAAAVVALWHSLVPGAATVTGAWQLWLPGCTPCGLGSIKHATETSATRLLGAVLASRCTQATGHAPARALHPPDQLWGPGSGGQRVVASQRVAHQHDLLLGAHHLADEVCR